jgi:predicted transcriptional regulator YheO
MRAKADNLRSEDKLLLREARKIVGALGRMFAPCCEVVLHDLSHPDHAIVTVENNLSGRRVGDPVTELGLARIKDPHFAEVVQNYANRFPDGRPSKSTSIGIKNSKGEFVAAICLNLDISLFASVQRSLSSLIAVDHDETPLRESLRARSVEEIRGAIEEFAGKRNQTPRGMPLQDKKTIVQQLNARGFLQIKSAVPAIAACLGVSRATIYNYMDRA